MHIKINTDSIYKRISKDVKSSEQLNNLFKDILTDDENIFASIDFGSGCYVWTLPSGYHWHKLSEATDETAVRNILSEKKSLIRRKLGGILDSGQLDAVFSVPSDDFIFYSEDESGRINVCLVAWDYQLPAKADVAGGGFKRPVPPSRQDVRLIFKAAGNPVSRYKCLMKTVSNSIKEIEADENGCLELKGLSLGYNCIVKSADKKRDFSFVVEEGKNQYVYDVTDELLIEVKVLKDGKDGIGVPVTVTYQGEDTDVMTDAYGIAEIKAIWYPEADVIARVEDQVASVKTEYPKTSLKLELYTPMATVSVVRRRNGRPLSDDEVIISVNGISSQVKRTDRDGTVLLNLPFHDNAELTVEAAGTIKSQKMEMENNFLFEDELPESFSPVLIVVDTNGENVADYSVIVEISGQSKEYTTDLRGRVILPETNDRQEMIVTDLSNPSSVRTYQLDHNIPEYEFVVPARVIEYYDIHVRHKNGDLPDNSSLSILQNGKNVVLQPDQEGHCRLRKDYVESGVNALAIVNLANEEFGRADVMFAQEEDDYEIILNQRNKYHVGLFLKQLLVAFTVTALFAVAFSAFTLLF